jgi:hypothetical protein
VIEEKSLYEKNAIFLVTVERLQEAPMVRTEKSIF